MKHAARLTLEEAYAQAKNATVKPSKLMEAALDVYYDMAFEKGVRAWTYRDGGCQHLALRKRVGQTQEKVLTLLNKVNRDSDNLSIEALGYLNKAINLMQRFDADKSEAAQ